MEQTLGKRISAGRKRLGLTQDQLAEKLGVTAQAVSKWENDQSCPDISMLPRLAEIFGITVDTLFGLQQEPVQQALEGTVEAASDASNRSEHGMWEFTYDNSRASGLWFAAAVLLTGCLWLASAFFHLGAGFWDIAWPVVILVFGLKGVYPRFSFFRLGCVLFGAYYLADNMGLLSEQLTHKSLILPVCLVIFGISLLADALRKPEKSLFSFRHNGKKHRFGKQINDYIISEDTFEYNGSFNEETQRVVMSTLRSGSINASFGEFVVDLSGVQTFAAPCHIEVSTSFGELCIHVPRRCLTRVVSNSSFAEIHTTGEPDPQATEIIDLEINASFGEVTVLYI